MRKRPFLITGGVLMLLLGVARGAGGLILLTRGSSADPRIQAADASAAMAGAFLLLLGITLVVSAAGVFRGRRTFWVAGVIGTTAFVVDGAVNGYVLYGRPGDQGTVLNVIVAVLILACLLAGRGALRGDGARGAGAGEERL